MRIRRPEPHTLAGAYALDALDGPDRARFERHAARCQECPRDVAGLREATARLAAAAAAQPPAALKEALRTETARTRQLPPVTHGSHATRRTRPRLGARRLALALGGAAAVASVTVWVTASLAPPARQASASQEIAKVLTAPDAVKLTAQVRTGGTATIVMSHHDGMLVFAAAGLRRLPAARHYELWLIGPGRDRAAGRLPAPSRDMTGPVVAAGLRSGDRLGLTVEPAGTHRPTTPMILEVTL